MRPKWNVKGKFDPLSMRLSRKDFSLFQFFISYNILEPSRYLAKEQNFVGKEANKAMDERLVLFGYEKTGVPPTTYSITLSSDSLRFQFILDEEDSKTRKVEGIMDLTCLNASWSLVKSTDCVSKQRANVERINLTQTSNKPAWGGFPDLLLPLPVSTDITSLQSHCLLKYTSTTHPNGNNVKTLHVDQACIYLIIPAWQYVRDFFKYLPSSPEIFSQAEMSSIMQVGDRFYRLLKNNYSTTTDGNFVAENTNHSSQETISRQFLFSLISPRIVLVADPSSQENDSLCVTLYMAHIDYLRETNVHNESQSMFCHGLEIFTGWAKNPSQCSSLVFPFSWSASLTKTMICENFPQRMSGWVWTEQLRARAAYTDLTSAIDVLNGIERQILSSKDCGNDDTPSSITVVTDEASIASEVKKTELSSSQPIVYVCFCCFRFCLPYSFTNRFLSFSTA